MEGFYLDTKFDISIVVPIYNGSKSLIELFERTQKIMIEMNKSFQFILVDDGSKDDSWYIIQKLKKTHKELVVGIKLAKNFGQLNATLCGIEHAKGNWIVTMDDDLEYPPESIPLLIEKQQKGNYDLIYGSYTNKKQSPFRSIGSKVNKYSNRMFNKRKFTESSFRLISSKLAKNSLRHKNALVILDETMTWYTDKIASVPVICEKSKQGKSRYHVFDLLRIHKSRTLINPKKQLQIVTTLGAIMMIVNFLFGIIIIYKKIFFSINVKGYTSLIVAILFSSGIIIFSIGIVAENINRLIKMNYKQPTFEEIEVIENE